MSKRRFMPAEAFEASEYISDELDARGWSVEELARRAVLPVNRCRELIAGAKVLASDSERLGVAFGVNSAMFATLDLAYRRWMRARPSGQEGK